MTGVEEQTSGNLAVGGPEQLLVERIAASGTFSVAVERGRRRVPSHGEQTTQLSYQIESAEEPRPQFTASSVWCRCLSTRGGLVSPAWSPCSRPAVRIRRQLALAMVFYVHQRTRCTHRRTQAGP